MTLNARLNLKCALRTGRLAYVCCAFRIRLYAQVQPEGEGSGLEGLAPPCGQLTRCFSAVAELLVSFAMHQWQNKPICTTMGKIVIKCCTRQCSYINRVRRVNYTTSCCKFPIIYVRAKNYENWCAIDKFIAIIKEVPFLWLTLQYSI